MFTGMKTADAALLKSCFADSMVLQTFQETKKERLVVRNESPQGLLILSAKSAGKCR